MEPAPNQIRLYAPHSFFPPQTSPHTVIYQPPQSQIESPDLLHALFPLLVTKLLVRAPNALLRNRILIALLPPQPRDVRRLLDANQCEAHTLDLVDFARGFHLGKFVGKEDGIWEDVLVAG
jgi:hypothetical protein